MFVFPRKQNTKILYINLQHQNDLKIYRISGQGFIKYLPVMHDSAKDMLRILKRCKTNKSLAVGNFHKKQPITPYNLKKYILLMQI